MRYLSLTESDRLFMRRKIGVKNIDELFVDIPSSKLQTAICGLSKHRSEISVERIMEKMAKRNLSPSSVPFFIGAGAYMHHIPASVGHLIQRSEFLTSYTPYQPEISQGTLQAAFEFQSFVSLITGMQVANASLYDGATACAEAVLMAMRITGEKQVIISGNVHPYYRDVVRTMMTWRTKTNPLTEQDSMKFLDGETNFLLDIEHCLEKETSCVVVQNPDFFGTTWDYTELAKIVHAKGALLIVVVTEIVSLGLLKNPGLMGADIVVGEGQSLGNPLSFGGPYVGLFATRRAYVRHMPGRLVGATYDRDGKRGFVITLAAREQHIRREKATSNVCTSSGLCALAFTIHLSLLGEMGFKKLAYINHVSAASLAKKINDKYKNKDITIVNKSFFNEMTLKLPKNVLAKDVVNKLADRDSILGGISVSRLLGKRFSQYLLVASTECTTHADQDAFVEALSLFVQNVVSNKR